MSQEEQNIKIVQSFFEKGMPESKTHPEVLHDYFADHYVDHSHVFETHDVHGVKAGVSEARNAAPDMKMEIVHQAAAGDLVFTHWQASWTHVKKLEKHSKLKTVEAHGAPVQVAGIFLFRMDKGKIVESWVYENTHERVMEAGKKA